jgi:peptidyl-prolyl cis-trans isomerase-like 3
MSQAMPRSPYGIRTDSVRLNLEQSIIYQYFAMSVTLHTSLGDLKVELACEWAPRMSRNFLALCAAHVYDDTVFHRCIAGFMVQGGDPSGTGKRGESADGGLIRDEFHPKLLHDARGVLAFANRGPDTVGSQFYITFGEAAHLNNVNSVFGRIIDGWDVLDAIEKTPIGQKHRPINDIVLERVTIHANPIADREA